MLENECADLVDQPHLLCHRHKDRRGDEAAFGMVPAQQRFHAGDPVVHAGDDRLIVHFELAIGERVAQVFFDPAAHVRPVL